MRIIHRPMRLGPWLLLGLTLWLGMASATHGLSVANIHAVCSIEGAMRQLPLDDSGTSRPLQAFHDCPLCATAWGPVSASAPALTDPLLWTIQSERARPRRLVVHQAITPPSRAPPLGGV